jgi:hypothetical protein
MSLVDTIRSARTAHITQFGVPPNAVFLGEHEADSLQSDLAFSQRFKAKDDKHEIDGMRIFIVKSKSHLTVCNTPEAPR